MNQPNEPTSGEQTRIIRRTPTGPIHTPVPTPVVDDTRTGIIRRAPTGAIPRDAEATGQLPRARSTRVPLPAAPVIPGPSAKSAVAACVVTMLSGWATSVVATDLITGWWSTDRLFCVAVGFLALVFALTSIAGVILLLLGRSLGRYLIILGAVVALLTFGGVFVAGARIPWVVYAIPVLPLTSAILALLPATGRWCRAL